MIILRSTTFSVNWHVPSLFIQIVVDGIPALCPMIERWLQRRCIKGFMIGGSHYLNRLNFEVPTTPTTTYIALEMGSPTLHEP